MREYRAEECILRYEEIKDKKRQTGIRITGFSGSGCRLRVPEIIGGMPVRVIGKKAFLSRKNLTVIELPETVEEIEDWAFAYCGSMERLTIPGGDIRLGRAILLDCVSLARVDGCGPEAWEKAYGYLLAAAVRDLNAEYLLEPRAVGSGEWLEKWDARLMAIMREDDTEGFSRQILCGEEDYGSTDLGAYISGQRRRKVRLAMLRLLYGIGLSETGRETLKAYLVNHTRGGESDETWRVLLEEYGEDAERRQLFLELGCVTEENIDGLLADIGDEYPEMTAAFLRYKEEHIGYRDFFDRLSL